MASVILLGALAIDLLIGEPPTRIHPVVWMGAFIDFFIEHAPKGRVTQLAWGAVMVLLGTALTFGLTWLALAALNRAVPVAAAIAGMLLFKVTFAVRGLAEHARAVQKQLNEGSLEKARSAAQFLVSRDTARLDRRQVTAATVESVAENTLDSIVAPLFWFLLLGVPGAMAYRFVNTADAMVGYHGRFEYLGKAAARLDDLLNWIPARLAFVLMVAGSWLAGLNARRSLQVGAAFREATASPNAGWTMSVAAGALSVPLEKVGQYRLGDDDEAHLIPRKIGDAIALMLATAAVSTGLLLLLLATTPLGQLPWTT